MTASARPCFYAARLNAFWIGAETNWLGKNRIRAINLLERAAAVDGLNAAGLNYPDHFDGLTPGDMRTVIDRLGVASCV